MACVACNRDKKAPEAIFSHLCFIYVGYRSRLWLYFTFYNGIYDQSKVVFIRYVLCRKTIEMFLFDFVEENRTDTKQCSWNFTKQVLILVFVSRMNEQKNSQDIMICNNCQKYFTKHRNTCIIQGKAVSNQKVKSSTYRAIFLIYSGPSI